MRLRLSSLALVGLFACSTSEEEPSMQMDGSSGAAETDTGSPSSSSDPSSPTAASTSGDASGEATTAEATTGPAESSGAFSTDDSSGSTSGPATSGGDTSSAETSGDEGPATECVELEACCDEIGSALFAGCISVVQMENAGLCDTILTNYHQEGYCTGETYCAELGDCCAELPPGQGWQDTCEYYADFGNQPQCAMLIGDYQLSDYCL